MKLNTVAAVGAALGICAVASAQSGLGKEDLYPYGFTIRAGVAIPLDKSLTNFASSLANLGVEYVLPTALLKGGESYFSLDYFWKAFGNNAPGSVIPVAINHRFYTSNANLRSYYFFGIGATFVSVNGNGTALSARGGVGQELGANTCAEIAAYISDRASGTRANAVTFNIGYRF